MDAGTCVLLLTYKRFDNLKQNLELILKYTNFPIYISIDGPKKGFFKYKKRIFS